MRLSKKDDHEYQAVQRAIEQLRRRGAVLYYTLQIAAEFWNVLTRPLERNGLGLRVDAAEQELRDIEGFLRLLPESEAVYREWRRLW